MNFPIDIIEDIKVSVSEACTNVIQHAYGDSQIKKILLILKPLLMTTN